MNTGILFFALLKKLSNQSTSFSVEEGKTKYNGSEVLRLQSAEGKTTK